MKILGELVSLGELRERLKGCALDCGLERRSVALTVLPDERSGNRLVLAHARSVDAAAVEGVRACFEKGLAGYERIADTAGVEEIPGGAIGKIDYGRLNSLISKGDKGSNSLIAGRKELD